jgi:hypothetical protein
MLLGSTSVRKTENSTIVLFAMLCRTGLDDFIFVVFKMCSNLVAINDTEN